MKIRPVGAELFYSEGRTKLIVTFRNNNNSMNNNNNEKEKLKKEYLRRLRLVSGTELNAKNKIQAIGSLAVPALR